MYVLMVKQRRLNRNFELHHLIHNQSQAAYAAVLAMSRFLATSPTP